MKVILLAATNISQNLHAFPFKLSVSMKDSYQKHRQLFTKGKIIT